MNIKIYAWKNGKGSKKKQDWVELTPKEYIEICNNNRNLKQERRRYFYQLPGLEKCDYYLYLECTYEQYLVSRAEKDERTRRRKEKDALIAKGKWYEAVSLDSIFEDESGDACTLHDVIPDTGSCFEDRLILSTDIQNALNTLTIDEIMIIEKLYLSNYALSENKLAKEMGIPRRTLGYKKKKILEKLKKSFASF